MDAALFSSLKAEFKNSVSSPLPFLEGDDGVSNKLRNECKTIYDFCKKSQGSSKPDPLPRLILEGFDNEQIWGQIELFNKKEAALCLKATDVLLSNEKGITLCEKDEDVCRKDQDEQCSEDEELADFKVVGEGSGSEDGFHFEESDENELGDAVEESDLQGEDIRKEKLEKTEVDDEFFSLRKMEKFLDEEDKKFKREREKPVEGDIDYFEDIPSSDDMSLDSDEEEKLASSSSKSSRHLKYEDYFDAPLGKGRLGKIHDRTNDHEQNESIVADETPSNKQSSFQRHRGEVLKRIEILEEKALAPADWQMKGEVKGNSRPENSLLQETLQFDHVARPSVEITEEHTRNLEDIIKQRILDEAWDDIERKYKPKDDAAEYKKRIVLDSSKSKLTLSEIYEKEYLEKTQKDIKKNDDEEESEEHTAIRKDMENLFRKLDALSNFLFTAPLPEPEIKLIANIPSIAKEEVQPITQADSQVLAPEEVFAKSTAGEEKSTQEKSSTDKKRERRKKKLKLKARAKARLEKLKALDPESDKVKSLEAINHLKKAAKAPGSNTTIIQGKPSNTQSKLTSQRFFTKLQEKGKSTNRQRKRHSQRGAE